MFHSVDEMYQWYVCHKSVVIFFVQAEDGIRDLVRSRGLGDVYKRQTETGAPHRDLWDADPDGADDRRRLWHRAVARSGSVSYTHLTLPTSDLV